MYVEALVTSFLLVSVWLFQVYKRYRKAAFFSQLVFPLEGDALLNDEGDGKQFLIDSDAVAFDYRAFGHVISWDDYSFYIRGERIVICSGEFHYWRLPDRSAWKRVLKMYKRIGWNTIRIYFHWGYHSPRESTYYFTDNRDIEYLLELCSEVGLYVLAAPGPYICAETQAGGLPIWLAQKRNVRLRHNVISGIRRYDAEYSAACEEWFRECLPLIARHQITSSAKGCVIALQLENENFEELPLNQILPNFACKILEALNIRVPFGVHDDMRHLAFVARKSGITVPFFSNDAWEAGSFMVKPDEPERFGLDVYGFDKYLIFAPVGNKSGGLGTASYSKLVAGCNGIEQRVRDFMIKAGRHTPIFIPELQGGWFNHYTVPYTYDDVYNFYGREFTADLVYLMLAEGCTAYNLYIGYGGTNWGMLGDPDVYTSYDYSACIREFRFVSKSGKLLRLANLHVSAFAEYWGSTAPTPLKGLVEPSKAAVKQRQSLVSSHISMYPVTFTFFHPTSHFKTTHVKVKLPTTSPMKEVEHSKFQLAWCTLKAEGSYPLFVSVSNYRAYNGVILLWSMLSIHARLEHKLSFTEVWVVQIGTGKRDMLFEGDFRVAGSSDTAFARTSEMRPWGTAVTFAGEKSGFVLLEQKGDYNPANESDGDDDSPSKSNAEKRSVRDQLSPSTSCEERLRRLLIIGLSEDYICTLQGGQILNSSENKRAFSSHNDYFAWGSRNVEDVELSGLESGIEVKVEVSGLPPAPETTSVYVLCGDSDRVTGASDTAGDESFSGCPLLKRFLLEPQVRSPADRVELKDWQLSSLAFGDIFDKESAPLDGNSEVRDACDLSKGCVVDLDAKCWPDPLDYGFVSGHITYRATFYVLASSQGAIVDLPDNSMLLRLNQRHRASVWCNGKFVGGNVVYNLRMFFAGAKVGPDPGGFHLKFGDHLTVYDGKTSSGTKVFDLSPFVAHGEFCTVSTAEFFADKKFEGDMVKAFKCTLVVLVESWGLNRQAFFLNDIRNPRGILDAKVDCKVRGIDNGAISQTVSWQIAGVNATKLANCFSTCGIPGESKFLASNARSWSDVSVSVDGSPNVELSPNEGILFMRSKFDLEGIYCLETPTPLRLHLEGEFTCFFWINETLMGRYYGNGDGPQHDFYLPDGLLKPSNNKLVFMFYTWNFTTPKISLHPWLIDEDGNVCSKDTAMIYQPKTLSPK